MALTLPPSLLTFIPPPSPSFVGDLAQMKLPVGMKDLDLSVTAVTCKSTLADKEVEVVIVYARKIRSN